ncbi:MAG TPA: hypothetical protein VFZ34_08090 [Blastocatellia bacterium]|nr:hypothetical protein [Blastocatellia bacterium]
MNPPTFRLLFLLLALWPLNAQAQGGGGDLPPVPKTASKSKPKTTKTKAATPKAAPKLLVAKEPAKVEAIAFNQLIEGKIEANTAGRIPPNVYYQEYTFTGTDADLFDIQVVSTQAAVKVELLDGNKISLPLKRDEQSGAYRLNTEGFTLPADAEYRIRVSVAPSPTLAAPIPFSLKLNHNGLTAAGYQHRLQQIVKGFQAQKPDESIGQLERLIEDDAKQAGAYEYLGLLYNEFKKDQVKASAAMLQAIKLGGAAIFKITHDAKWRRPNRDRKTQRLAFEELKTSWLRVSSTQLVIADFNVPDKALATFTRAQLKEISRFLQTQVVVVKHANKQFKPDTLALGLGTPAEADIVVDLINGNLLKKE